MSSAFPSDFRERFWSKVDRTDPNGCWLWRAATAPRGYGRIKLGGLHQRAHRVAYELSNGPIPEGLYVLHACDRPGCVNPDHLRVGTQTENMADMDARGRRRTARGRESGRSKLTEPDVLDILARLARGERASVLASEYGVKHDAIRSIITRRTWKHVTA